MSTEEIDFDDAALEETVQSDVKFRGSDATQTVPHPKKLVLVAPSQPVAIVKLPHFRHGKPSTFFLCEGPTQICEVQTSRPEFAAWLVGDEIECDGALQLGSPVDPCFFALSLAANTQNASVVKEVVASMMNPNEEAVVSPKFTFKDFDTTVEDSSFASLPQAWLKLIEREMHRVCEVQMVDDQTFMRLDLAKAVEWLSNIFRRLTTSAELQEVLFGSRAVVPAQSDRTPEKTGDSPLQHAEPSTEPKAVEGAGHSALLELRARGILLEYVPSMLHDLVKSKTGEAGDLDAKSRAEMRVRQRQAWEDERSKTEAPVEKKRKTEVKSVALKRLEKAGPPKGTPSLMGFFKK